MATHKKPLGDSEFQMWRAVFAFALVDNILSMEEQNLLRTYYNAIPFSDAQRETLRNDFLHPQDVEKLYNRITEPEHRTRFCMLARALVWCEGDMDRQEAEILKRVKCLKDGDALKESRTHPHLHTCYRNYARAGVGGLVRTGLSLNVEV